MLGKEAITWGNIAIISITVDHYSISLQCWTQAFNDLARRGTGFSSTSYIPTEVNDALKRGLYVRG